MAQSFTAADEEEGEQGDADESKAYSPRFLSQRYVPCRGPHVPPVVVPTISPMFTDGAAVRFGGVEDTLGPMIVEVLQRCLEMPSSRLCILVLDGASRTGLTVSRVAVRTMNLLRSSDTSVV